MANPSQVVPPQPKVRLVMRRVKAHRCGQAAGVSAFALVATALFDTDAVLLHHSGPMFWLAISILCVTLACSLVASFFHLTEQPRQVEVQDRPSSSPHVIHMTGKQ